MRFVVATEDGSLQHILATPECNAADKDAPLPEIRLLDKDSSNGTIQCMTFLLYPETSDEYLEAIAVAYRDGSVSIYDVDDGEILMKIPASTCSIEDLTNKANEDDSFISIEYRHRVLATCTSSGHARFTVIDAGAEPKTTEYKLPAPISVMRMHPLIPGVIAFGGKENDLQIWMSGTQDIDSDLLWTDFTPHWKAKNVKNDELDLRVPIWISDLQFLPTTDKEKFLILTSTRFQQIRKYDTSKARRPIQSFEMGQYPISQMLISKCAVTPSSDSTCEIIFSDTQSNISHASIQSNRGLIIGSFKGGSGAATSIHAVRVGAQDDDDGQVYVDQLVTGGMDSYLRAYDISTHAQKCSVYLKNRIKHSLCLPSLPEVKNEEEDDGEKNEDEDEDVWQGIEEISDDRPSKRRKNL